MRTKQSIIDEQREEISALRRNVADYRARHDLALSELAGIAQGHGVRPLWFANHGWEVAIQHKAGLALARIGAMALREAP